MKHELINLNIKAPTAMMIRPAAAMFSKLRQVVIDGSGFDFLGVCGDVLRPADYVSKKDGVANRSWHKTGRAFDYDQTSNKLVIVSEPQGGKQFFRTYLMCARQDGSRGVKRLLRDYRGGSTNSYVFDFTAAAQSCGLTRIPAWKGWQDKDNYNRREFWHYQYNPEGVTWDDAMLQLIGKSRSSSNIVVGLNDRGKIVLDIQKRLLALGLLPADEVDGVYGAITFGAVKMFQKQKGLDADGLVGPNTRKELFT